jgi:hypothetical protein
VRPLHLTATVTLAEDERFDLETPEGVLWVTGANLFRPHDGHWPYVLLWHGKRRRKKDNEPTIPQGFTVDLTGPDAQRLGLASRLIDVILRNRDALIESAHKDANAMLATVGLSTIERAS